MEDTQLGRSGLSVSRLVLGTMNFGTETSEQDSHTIMNRAHEHGINFFDTANVYGTNRGESGTEHIIGRWFAQGGGEKTVLATKLRSLAITLDHATLDRLDELFPPPAPNGAKPAPEAYAW